MNRNGLGYGLGGQPPMLPIPERRGDDLYRVYFSGRDDRNRSLVGYVEFDIREPSKILQISEKPVLGLGELGTFDDNGVTPSWIVDHRGKKYLYYVGWNQGSTVRMAEMAGLAISIDGGEQFTRVSRSPILKERIGSRYRCSRHPVSESKMESGGCGMSRAFSGCTGIL